MKELNVKKLFTSKFYLIFDKKIDLKNNDLIGTKKWRILRPGRIALKLYEMSAGVLICPVN